jgi:LysM repeat protein
MNFSSDSVKLEISPHKEDFYLDVDTPHGHVFAVLDFAPHDYVNLTPALKSRLEMIINSFESTAKFSADFFLGFLALEINNYLSNLSKQSEGQPPILCSAALCLVHGNQLSYFHCGDVLLNVLTGGRLVPLNGAGSGKEAPLQLGARNSQMTLTNQVKSLTLQDTDMVLILTQGIGKTLDNARLAREVMSLKSSDPKIIRDALLSASATSRSDRTVVAIAGPYTPASEPTLADLSKAVASLEAKLNTLTQNPTPEIGAAAVTASEAIAREDDFEPEVVPSAGIIGEPRSNYRSLAMAAALATLVIALIGGFAGSWFQSRTLRKGPEVWTVRTSGTQIEIARLDENGPHTVSLSLEQPARTTGEQKFSSFSDVKQYLEMISSSAGTPNQPNQASQTIAQANQPAAPTIEYTAKPGDSLMSLAWRHRVSPEKLQELNPSITKWRSIQVGQKIALPSPTPPDAATSTQGEVVASNNVNANSNAMSTTEVTVGPGDSVMKLARRHNISQEQLRALNPNISRWPLLQIGQRISLPASTPAPPSQTASPRGELVASANPAGNANEVTVRQGDSVLKFARRNNVSPEELRRLNPNITRWPLLRLGDKITLPAPGAQSSPVVTQSEPTASPASSPPQPAAAPNAPAAVKEVIVGRGESLNSLAERFKCSARQLKLLNPRIRNWASIHPGQKIVVPALPGS